MDGKIKLQLKTTSDFREGQRILEKQNIFFYTNMLNMDKPFKYIMKGIHPSITEQEIEIELKNLGFVVERI
ncbi:hypothetical protein JGG71_23670, partial [Salmonella enterica subsp. enterica serovar Derby]|nr:hypothetical protein [Salmonella enterica subsp. enterica serovar Derby]